MIQTTMFLQQRSPPQILDATNTTQDRRDLILERCPPEGIQVMFIESVLDDALIEETNIRVCELYYNTLCF